MTLRKDIESIIDKTQGGKYNYTDARVRQKRSDDATDKICQLFTERLEKCEKLDESWAKNCVKTINNIDQVIRELKEGE